MHHFVHNRHGIKVVGQDGGSWTPRRGRWVNLEIQGKNARRIWKKCSRTGSGRVKLWCKSPILFDFFEYEYYDVYSLAFS